MKLANESKKATVTNANRPRKRFDSKMTTGLFLLTPVYTCQIAFLCVLAMKMPLFAVEDFVPGVIDPTCTKEEVCTKGYTKTVRPSVGYTDHIKIQRMKKLKLPGKASDFELDHKVPLELCGDPASQDNLWMQPWTGEKGAHHKDIVENRLHECVCQGLMSLETAQKVIKTDWYKAYQEIQKGVKCPK